MVYFWIGCNTSRPISINSGMTLPALKAKLDPQITEILTAKIQKSTAKANKANKEDKMREQ
jgi:hypothetical protein